METLKANDPRLGDRSGAEVRWPATDISGRGYKRETSSTHDLGNGRFVVFSRRSPLPEGGVVLEGSKPTKTETPPATPLGEKAP